MLMARAAMASGTAAAADPVRSGTAAFAPADVLLLQGPVGPFFAELSEALRRSGARVLRVTFNPADTIFSGGAPRVPYRGDVAGVGPWLARLVRNTGARKIVLFGDGRPMHAEARNVAEALGIEVWCLEEGYVRPGFVTLELGGNNANSPLRHGRTSPGGALPAPEPCAADGSFAAMAASAILQHVVATSACALGVGSLHRPRPLHREVLCWMLNAVRRHTARSADGRIAAVLKRRRYWLAAMQVHDDAQLAAYGRGWTMPRFVEEVVAAFAEAASPDDLLVFKPHPLDLGHLDYGSMIRRAAKRHGVTDRTTMVSTGPLAPLAKGCAGLVTVNSTSGLSGLHHGRPVLTLGEAFYAGAGLAGQATDRAGIAAWLRDPEEPEEAAWQDLRERMRGSLVPGSFYAPAQRAATAARVAERILRGP